MVILEKSVNDFNLWYTIQTWINILKNVLLYVLLFNLLIKLDKCILGSYTWFSFH